MLLPLGSRPKLKTSRLQIIKISGDGLGKPLFCTGFIKAETEIDADADDSYMNHNHQYNHSLIPRILHSPLSAVQQNSLSNPSI